MSKIDKVIEYFRNLRENAPVMTSSPTMNTSTPNGSPGGSSSADSSGPFAGLDHVMSFRRRKNGKVDGRSASKKYKTWLKSLKMM
jgi:hypothetical protein